MTNPTSPIPVTAGEVFPRPAPHAPLVPLPLDGPLRIKDLIPMQIEAAIADDARLIIPVGTCEQHGPHLPLGTATIIAEHLADDLSAEFMELRAPTVESVVNVDIERGFIGNASVRTNALRRALSDLIDPREATGFKEFILLTAHGHDPPQEALSTVITG